MNYVASEILRKLTKECEEAKSKCASQNIKSWDEYVTARADYQAKKRAFDVMHKTLEEFTDE